MLCNGKGISGEVVLLKNEKGRWWETKALLRMLAGQKGKAGKEMKFDEGYWMEFERQKKEVLMERQGKPGWCQAQSHHAGLQVQL